MAKVGPENKGVVTGSSRHHIIARATQDRIVAGCPREGIVTGRATKPSLITNLGAVPHRPIGEGDLFNTIAAKELSTNRDCFTSGADLHEQVVTAMRK